MMVVNRTDKEGSVNRYLFLLIISCLCINSRATAEELSESEGQANFQGDAETASQEKTDTSSAPDNDENEALKARVADLEAKVDILNQQAKEDELQKIIEEAEAEAKAPEEAEKPEERTFLWGALALQKLNPELSLSADVLASFVIDDDRRFFNSVEDRSRISIREVGLQLQHVLDPYSMFKACLNFIPEPEPEVEVEEVYITWFGIVPSLSLTVGRFRQNFGVVNRWHGHDLDQTQYPMAMTQVLGEGGINQTGIVLKWFMPPLIAHANEFVLEVTNAENETLFAGEHFSIPSILAHLKNYYDLSDSTYLELGLSGIFGTNNKRGYLNDDNALKTEDWRQTWAAGADLTISWAPPSRAKYRGFTWRTEAYFVHKETATSQDVIDSGWGEADGNRVSWGAFSYIDVRLSPKWIVGVRGDVALPTVRVVDDVAWDIVPYITFWQSEFVYLRLEYQHKEKIPMDRPDETIGRITDNRVLLQIDFAAGPHKHEKY